MSKLTQIHFFHLCEWMKENYGKGTPEELKEYKISLSEVVSLATKQMNMKIAITTMRKAADVLCLRFRSSTRRSSSNKTLILAKIIKRMAEALRTEVGVDSLPPSVKNSLDEMLEKEKATPQGLAKVVKRMVDTLKDSEGIEALPTAYVQALDCLIENKKITLQQES